MRRFEVHKSGRVEAVGAEIQPSSMVVVDWQGAYSHVSIYPSILEFEGQLDCDETFKWLDPDPDLSLKGPDQATEAVHAFGAAIARAGEAIAEMNTVLRENTIARLRFDVSILKWLLSEAQATNEGMVSMALYESECIARDNAVADKVVLYEKIASLNTEIAQLRERISNHADIIEGYQKDVDARDDRIEALRKELKTGGGTICYYWGIDGDVYGVGSNPVGSLMIEKTERGKPTSTYRVAMPIKKWFELGKAAAE